MVLKAVLAILAMAASMVDFMLMSIFYKDPS
jgi:hypothetical protein